MKDEAAHWACVLILGWQIVFNSTWLIIISDGVSVQFVQCILFSNKVIMFPTQ